AAPCAPRQLGAPARMAQHTKVPRGIDNRRKRDARNSEYLEQRRIPLGRAELRTRRRRWIRRESGSEPIAEERVPRPETQRPLLEGTCDGRVALEQPGQLPGREVRIQRHPAALPDLLGTARRLEPVEDLQRALVLPCNDRGERLPGRRIPRQDRLPLMIKAACVDRRRRVGQDDLRILLDPP